MLLSAIMRVPCRSCPVLVSALALAGALFSCSINPQPEPPDTVGDASGGGFADSGHGGYAGSGMAGSSGSGMGGYSGSSGGAAGSAGSGGCPGCAGAGGGSIDQDAAAEADATDDAADSQPCDEDAGPCPEAGEPEAGELDADQTDGSFLDVCLDSSIELDASTDSAVCDEDVADAQCIDQ